MSADAIEMTTEETTVTPDAPTSIADLSPKMQLAGTVKRLELYGAFIELSPGLTGLIHVSKLGGEQVNRVSDVLKEPCRYTPRTPCRCRRRGCCTDRSTRQPNRGCNCHAWPGSQ